MKLTDTDGDILVIDDAAANAVHLSMEEAPEGFLLSPFQVKLLRRHLKQWLSDNGHRKPKT